MAAAARKIKQYGLSELYVSPNQTPPLVDIVLVHGLNGHPKDTWTSKKGEVFWPLDILPAFLGTSRVRVLTYGYNANVTSFTDGASKDRIHHHAETLASELSANRNLRGFQENPIIFVCHSLGGLVVKRCMIACRSQENDKLRHLRSIYISTFGILFMGTPHTGSDVAKWGLLLQKICSAVLPKKFMDTSPQLIESLKSNNEVLQNINRLFNDFFSRFHIYFFHETKPLDMKGTREFIVDEASAAPDIEGAERMGIEADHSSMVKFEDDSSPGFEAVAEAIIRYSREAPNIIAGRWVEEKAHVQLQIRSKADEITRSTGEFSQEPQAETENRMGNSVPNLPLPPIFSPDNTPRMTQSVEILPPQRGSLFVVPPGFHPNGIFIGMEKELKELHIRLFKSKKREERATAVLICGGPGSGKTHLARQYVHMHRKDFPGGIFWIDARTSLSMSTCYWDVAQAAALISSGSNSSGDSKYPASTDASVYMDQVRHWFESKEEWLIVFDGLNFDEDSQLNAFKKYLPFRPNTSIIYTSVDRTLAKKQRLFEPYCLTVRPLKVEEARKLLFNTLDIKKPTPEQWNKATEIVDHYQCLPLAIHAISHRLSATQKPLERYHINSHLTDHKLAEPFVGIIHDLHINQHFEAINLINILAFFGHHIPVAMISWGRSALESQNISILTSSRSGEPGDIDTTLGVLIQYGLIERVSDPYPEKSLLLPSISDKESKFESPDSEHSATDSFTEGMPAPGIYQNAIDVIKIHSVVQTCLRDELKILDGKIKQQQQQQRLSVTTNQGSTLQQTQGADFPGYFLGWLLNATRIFGKSYENARYKMAKDRTGALFVKDLREYETHAERLICLYKKLDIPKGQPTTLESVKEAKKLLRDAVRDIGVEIGKISPNSTEDSFRLEKSIFNRSSSSSSGPSSSMEDSVDSQRSTFYGDWETVQVQSPVEISVSKIQDPHQFSLAAMYRQSLEEEKNDGYLSDGEGFNFRARRESSASSSRYSQITEKPLGVSEFPGSLNVRRGSSESSSRYSQTTERLSAGADILNPPAASDGPASGESGWETVVRRKRRVEKPQGPSQRRSKFRGRLNRDLGSYRPSPVTKLSSAQGEGSMSRLSSTALETSPKPNNAKDILESYFKTDARKSKKERTSPRVPSSIIDPKENSSPWAVSTQGVKLSNDMPQFALGKSAPSDLDRPQNTSPLPRPLSTAQNRLELKTDFSMEPSSGQSSVIPSPTSIELGKNRASALSYSDPAIVRVPRHRDPSSAPGSRNHSRNPSVFASYDGRDTLRSPVPLQSSVSNPSRLALSPIPSNFEVQHRKNGTRNQNLDVYPPPFISMSPPPPAAFPGGYTSAPLSVAMSRDPSGQSRASWQTEPNPLSRQTPQVPSQLSPPNSYGAPLLAPNSRPAISPRYTPVAQPGPRVQYERELDITVPTVTAPSATEAASTSIFFGELQVDVDEARQRVIDWSLRQPPVLMARNSTGGGGGAFDPSIRQTLLQQSPLDMQSQILDQEAIPVPFAVAVPVPVPVTTPTRSRSGSCTSEPAFSGLGVIMPDR